MSFSSSRPGHERLLLAGLLLLIAVLAVGSLLMSRKMEGVDDAFISYRFAANFAAGRGLVFNPGERVEGYTNLLYVLMIVPAFKLGLQGTQIYDYSVGLNILASVGTLLLLAWYVHRRYGGAAMLIGGVLFAACPTIWFWNASGMETPWALLLQLALIVTAARLREERRAAPLVLGSAAAGALVLVRADGFVAVGFVVLFLLLQRRWRAALVLGGVAAAVLLAVTLWRLHYYGLPLPNTYYAKVTGALPDRLRSAARSLVLLRNMWIYWAILAIHATVTLRAALRERRARLLEAGLILSAGLLVYLAYIGGDVMKERMLLIHIPVAILALFSLGWAPRAASAEAEGQPGAPPAPPGSPRLRPTLAGLAVPLVLLLYQGALPDHHGTAPEDAIAWRSTALQRHPLSLLGEHLRRHETGRTLATGALGQLGFYSELPMIDMLGLCDAHIARAPARKRFVVGHSKSDPDYVLARRPDLIAETFADDGRMFYGWGTRWREHGYVPKYACGGFAGRVAEGLPQVRDIRGASPEEIRGLRHMGYTFLVVEKPATP